MAGVSRKGGIRLEQFERVIYLIVQCYHIMFIVSHSSTKYHPNIQLTTIYVEYDGENPFERHGDSWNRSGVREYVEAE